MTTLYEKVGRRYKVWGDGEDWSRSTDLMKVGEARLTVCYAPGAKRYVYGVKPDAAGFVAAAQLAAAAMVDAMQARAVAAPQLRGTPYTAEQLRLIEQFRADMAAAGGLLPSYWTIASSQEIAQAGTDAVIRFAEANAQVVEGGG
jgi:hypothetical protein